MNTYDMKVTYLDEEGYIVQSIHCDCDANSSEEATDMTQINADKICEEFGYYEAEVSCVGA